MIRLAAEHGVSVESCLSTSGVTPAQLADPSSEVSGQQELSVLRNILRVLDPAVPFGLQAGLRYHATAQGMWGFAVLSCPDARSAIELGLRYFDLTFSFNQVRFEVADQEARLVYDGSDNPDDLQAVLIERDLGALAAMERDAYGRVIAPIALRLRAVRPAYAAEFETLFGVEPQFGARENSLTFDARLLGLQLPLADAFGLRVSEEQCRRLVERREARSGVASRVRAQILHKPAELPSMQTVAQRLGVSPRTLHKRLAREGTSYRDLVEEVREALAEELLSTVRLSIDEVAQRLGYSDTSSFIVAFKRWKGVSPGEYKRTHGN